MGNTRHYVALDGLRGVAALMVLGTHVETKWGLQGPFSHGYLSVDFFFILSGFVIGHAYETKLATGKLSLGGFAFARWARLYPMMVIGALIGLAAAIVDPVQKPLMLALASQLLFIPILQGDVGLYLLNPVQWSLLLEGLANAAHALSLKWLSSRFLAAVCLVGLAILVMSQAKHQWLDAGFSANTLKRGLGRILYGYPAGLLLYRGVSSGRLKVVRTSFWAVSALLCAVMVACAYAEAFRFTDVAAILTFPALVWAGLGASPVGAEAKIADSLGRASYPMYAIHFPLVALFVGHIRPSPIALAAILLVGFIIALSLDPLDAWIRSRLAGLRPSRLRASAA